MLPDDFQTELSGFLTDFYENILKKACAGGRPVAMPLSGKFVTKAASLPAPDPLPAGPALPATTTMLRYLEPTLTPLRRRQPLLWRKPQRAPPLWPSPAGGRGCGKPKTS
jgi:hypothetical protein